MTKKHKSDNTIFIMMIVSMVIAFVFIMLYTIAISSNAILKQELSDYQTEYTNCQEAYSDLEKSRVDLYNNWLDAFNDLKNCYKNGLPSCSTSTPNLS